DKYELHRELISIRSSYLAFERVAQRIALRAHLLELLYRSDFMICPDLAVASRADVGEYGLHLHREHEWRRIHPLLHFLLPIVAPGQLRRRSCLRLLFFRTLDDCSRALCNMGAVRIPEMRPS